MISCLIGHRGQYFGNVFRLARLACRLLKRTVIEATIPRLTDVSSAVRTHGYSTDIALVAQTGFMSSTLLPRTLAAFWSLSRPDSGRPRTDRLATAICCPRTPTTPSESVKVKRYG